MKPAPPRTSRFDACVGAIGALAVQILQCQDVAQRIREFATLNLATEPGATTRVGDDNLLMAYSHIAHNCEVGNRVVIANAVQFAGYVTVEDWAIVGGGTMVHQFARIGRGAIVGGNASIVGSALFGLSAVGSGTYVILETKTGTTICSGQPRAANNAAFQKAGNTLIVLENDGELVVVDGSNTSGFTPIKKYKVSDTETWSAPALSGNRVFVKDESTVALWTVN